MKKIASVIQSHSSFQGSRLKESNFQKKGIQIEHSSCKCTVFIDLICFIVYLFMGLTILLFYFMYINHAINIFKKKILNQF